MWSTKSRRSVEKNRAAIMPTKNGAIIAAIAAVPNAGPMKLSEKIRVPSEVCAEDRYVLSVTNPAPHTKYCRNIITERRVRTSMCCGPGLKLSCCQALLFNQRGRVGDRETGRIRG